VILLLQRGRLLVALTFWVPVFFGTFGSPPAVAARFTTQEMTIAFTQTDKSVLQLATLVLIPETGGRFPLAVVSHGSPRHDYDRARMAPTDLLSVGKWLIDQGYAVAIPMRRGYGLSNGQWAEGFGSCQSPDYARAGRASAQDIEAVISYMRGQSFVDASRVILIGHSAGGWGSIAAASETPPGVVAVVAFAPGRGSLAPDEVCGGGDALISAAHLFGTTTRIPTLWIYSDNDHFFSPKLARSIFDAFRATTHGTAEFVESPSCSLDGHMLLNRCPDAWHSVTAAFLGGAVGGN
jgi:dienelactone hydrolase